MNKYLLVLSAVLPLLPGLLACSSAPRGREPAVAVDPFEPFSWVELGPDAKVIARVITAADRCPDLFLNGETRLSMTLRAAPTEKFGARSCEALIPKGTISATLGELELPLPKNKPRKILFIGDTGCRIQARGSKLKIQSCNDPGAWPFPAMIRKETEIAPDLVVHLGDYLYREIPCPAGNAACAGSPSGDTWETWRADFFEAARPLLRKAPWVFVRGNHELCKRGGQGWFRFLDPSPMQVCTDVTPPYLIQLKNAQFVVHDSALATDLKPDPEQVPLYRAQFEAIAAMPLDRAWLVTHKPLWVPATLEADNPHSPMSSFNQTMQAASGNHLPAGISTLFSGHLHLFEELQFADGRAGQLVIGNGGTSLNKALFRDPVGIKIGGTTISAGTAISDFGFFTLESSLEGKWKGTVFDGQGASKLSCSALSRGFRCAP